MKGVDTMKEFKFKVDWKVFACIFLAGFSAVLGEINDQKKSQEFDDLKERVEALENEEKES